MRFLATALALMAGTVIGALVYFLPTIIAGRRNHNNTLAIFALNLLLGWIVIGWIVALIWACTANTTAGVPSKNTLLHWEP